MLAPSSCLRSVLMLLLALVASIVVWLPLVAATQTRIGIADVPLLDQRVEFVIGSDQAADFTAVPRELSAPYFNALCETEIGLWSQTTTVGATARLSEIELLLLRRAPDDFPPVFVEIRSVDTAGRPTEAVLARGVTQATIPFHRATPDWLTVQLDTPVLLLRGEKVAIFPTSTPSASGSCYEWVSSGLDVYAGGTVAVTHDRGVTFVLAGGKDAAFRTWTR